MGLLKKRCWLCSKRIDKGKEFFKDKKSFCSEEHANEYYRKCGSQRSGGCCGNCG